MKKAIVSCCFLLLLSGVLGAQVGSIAEGEPFASLEWDVADGSHYSTQSLSGSVYLLKFGSISCSHCRVDDQRLSNFVSSLPVQWQHRLNFFYFQAGPGNSLEAAESIGYHYVDDFSVLYRALGIRGIPTHVLVGSDGTVLWMRSGSASNIAQILKQELEQALEAGE